VAQLPDGTAELIERALAEDLGDGDLTATATVAGELEGSARIILKEPGAVYGLEVAREVFRQSGAAGFEHLVEEGRELTTVPLEVARVTGPVRAILAGERTALNLLGHLSGITYMTIRFVSEVAGTGAFVLDTRKTTPGLRNLEKAAVAAGGGVNHRFGLYDGILIKENHIEAAGGIGPAVAACHEMHREMPVEVEAETVEQVREAIEAGADRILLDNMDLQALRDSVAERDGNPGKPVALEASGGITLANVREVAATGVDFISVGSLTHSAPALDFSLLIEKL
jgi:nicotinate-nucleotide pyrophosphorylase (carboxylating)